MKQPLISVIIPFLNADWSMLKECLDSIAVQGCQDYEVLLIDDGSTDFRMLKNCQSYVEAHSRFELLHNERNRGVSYSRNRGIELSKGRFVLFVDADDWIEPDMFALLAEQVQNPEVDTVFFEYSQGTPGDLKPMFRSLDSDCKQPDPQMIRQFILSNDFNSPFSTLYAGELLKRENIRFPEDMVLGEDFMFNMAYLKAYRRGSYLRKSLYNYRIHGGSVTKKFAARHVEDTNRIYFYRKGLLSDQVENTHRAQIKDAFDAIYFRAIRAYLLNGINAHATDEGLESCLQQPWVQDLMGQEAKDFMSKLIKMLIEKRCFWAFRLLAFVKRILLKLTGRPI